jgi:methylenetetrahydrofolate dehydrogenase (NADP+)/methenyltetrahydrofolate cyclohydrolase
VLAALRRLNADRSVHGILVQLPLPSALDPAEVVAAIDPSKDVDGLHPFNYGLLLAGTPRFVPATPSGIQRLLIEEGVETSGAHVVICGRSNIVGRPMAALMLRRGPGANATVTVCHTGTRDLPSFTRQADILIVAIGRPQAVRGDMVRPGAVVVDVGVNRVADRSRRSGFRLVGDVAFDEVAQVASLITPVPGGVGPMTIAMLLENTLAAARYAVSGKAGSV